MKTKTHNMITTRDRDGRIRIYCDTVKNNKPPESETVLERRKITIRLAENESELPTILPDPKRRLELINRMLTLEQELEIRKEIWRLYPRSANNS